MEEKIRNSRGEIYESCPLIDRAINSINQVKSDLENIRVINSELRKESAKGDYKEKLKIVEIYLGIRFENIDIKLFERECMDIEHNILTLQEEIKLLKEKIELLENN